MRVPLGDGFVREWRVDSSDGVTAYLVRCLPGGLWTCTCPGCVNRGRCRHITQVRKRLARELAAGGDLL